MSKSFLGKFFSGADCLRSIPRMAKMFYTIEETANKLGVAESRVRWLAENGHLQQFRDRDALMFKREQVDAVADQAVHNPLPAPADPLDDAKIAAAIETARKSLATFNAAVTALRQSGVNVSIIYHEDDDPVKASFTRTVHL